MFLINEIYPHLHDYASSCIKYLEVSRIFMHHASSILKYHASSYITHLHASCIFMHHTSSCSRSIFKNLLLSKHINIFYLCIFNVSLYSVLQFVATSRLIVIVWNQNNKTAPPPQPQI